jgi:hypothetical protein
MNAPDAPMKPVGGEALRIRLKAVMREPLTHFLIAGFAVFLWSAWRGEPVDPANRTITVDARRVEALAQNWSATWGRPPTPDEIDGLIQAHIKEEVYYREALRLGLDADDAIIRRRLMSKMEFLAAAEVEAMTPDEATLRKWVARNPSRYAEGARLSFDQIYLGDRAPDAVLQRVRSGGDWRTAGSAISLSPSFDRINAGDLDRQFGDGFAASLERIGPGQWAGPVQSGFGAHLVRVRERQPGRVPALAEIRRRVENDWRAATRVEREAKAYQALLDAYTIRIARP